MNDNGVNPTMYSKIIHYDCKPVRVRHMSKYWSQTRVANSHSSGVVTLTLSASISHSHGRNITPEIAHLFKDDINQLLFAKSLTTRPQNIQKTCMLDLSPDLSIRTNRIDCSAAWSTTSSVHRSLLIAAPLRLLVGGEKFSEMHAFGKRKMKWLQCILCVYTR